MWVADEWSSVITVANLSVLLVLLITFARIAFSSSIPVLRQLLRTALSCIFCVLGIAWFAESNSGRISPWKELAAPFEYFLFGGLPLWFTALWMQNVLRRTPADFDLRRVRRTAALSLFVFVSLYAWAILITVDSQNTRDWPGSRSAAQRFATYNLLFAASLATGIPWFWLIRRRAMYGLSKWSALDLVSMSLLICSLLAIFLWLVLRLSSQSFVKKGGLGAALGIIIVSFHSLPVGSCFFLGGFLIEVWRDRWHHWLTMISGTFFVAYWLLWALEPDLNYLPLLFKG